MPEVTRVLEEFPGFAVRYDIRRQFGLQPRVQHF
jgi:hypothetical protein